MIVEESGADGPAEETLADDELHHTSRPGREITLERGEKVGRYVVLDRIGAGGMGVVYAAYDPDLDRRVALKLLKPEDSGSASKSEGRHRLLREAQAMAKLSHPNVVAVHDVGLHEDQVFMAMEFVQGTTFGERARRGEREWRETLRLFLEAGRGLAAAHAAGLVHRDFKPDNVLLGDRGRVKVTDFGLAFLGELKAPRVDATDQLPVLESASRLPTLENMTHSGAVVGTPAYMAPEQHLGLKTDAASDQFSFCVALYACLYGERPFAGKTRDAIVLAVTSGEVEPAPAQTNVPGWVRAILLRGLRPDPQERWPDMKALLAELERDPSAARKRFATIGVGVAMVGAIGWFGATATSGTSVCSQAGEGVETVWNEARKEELREALHATKVGFAETTWTRVETGLDEYGGDWSTQRVEACEATQVRGEQSQSLLDLRMQCLDERLSAMSALIDVLVEADATIAENAVSAVGELPRLARCADADALRARHPRPEDPAKAAAVSKLEAELQRATARGRSGKFKEGLESAGAVARGARELDYPPLLVEALYRQGVLQHATDESDAAVESLKESFFSATRSDLDESASAAASELTFLLGHTLAKEDEGRAWSEHALALADAAGSEDLRGTALNAAGGVALKAGKFDEARAQLEQALEIRQRLDGVEHERLLGPLNQLGLVASDTGDYARAKELFERGLEIGEEALGADHPNLAKFLNNLAKIAWAQGQFDVAKAEFERALALQEAALGPKHRNVAQLHNNLAAVAYSTGELEEATRRFELALGIWREALGPKHPTVADGLNNLAAMHSAREDYETSRRLDEEALEIRLETMDADHPAIAQNYNNLGEDLLNLGRADEALELHTKALEIWEKKLEPGHDDIALALTSIGQDHIVRTDPGAALPFLERAWSMRENAQIDPVERATTAFLLAHALRHAAGGDRSRAKELDALARRALDEAGPHGTERLEWLEGFVKR